MGNDEFNALEAVKQLGNTAGREHLRTTLLASIELVPMIGGALSTLLADYLPNWKFERVTQFLADFAADVEHLKARIDENAATTSEFGLLLEHVLQQVSRTPEREQEKFRAYRAVLLNSCLPSTSDELERAYFLDLVDRLQEVHVVILSLFRDQYAFGRAHDSGPAKNQITSSLRQTIAAYLRPLEISDELVQSAIGDLDFMGILPGLHQSLGTMMSAHGAVELSSRLRDFGRRFADFLALPIPNTDEA
ncbi:MAG: hypothetical protein GXX96_01665 [Planctomycetaceae bacterium]|nr:hypothetical protein [Planctomycetaceae bacterium]